MELKLKNNSNLRLRSYTELEYIESTGTQWIDTGVKPTNNTRLQCEVDNLNSSILILFGCRTGEYQENFCITNYNSNRLRYGNQQRNANATNKIILDANKNNWTINSTTISFDSQIFSCRNSFTLFGCNINGSIESKNKSRVHYCTFYENNVIICNLIPVIDRNDVVCMYDTVSMTYFYNQGTDDFIAGPVVNNKSWNPALFKASTLYHENCPNINGWALLNTVYNWNINNQTEVKYLHYRNSATWQTIITQHPEFETYTEANHGFLIAIYEQDDPIAVANQLALIIEQYPTLVPIIIEYPTTAPIITENPEVVHSLIDTDKETWLANNTNAFIDTGIIMRYTYSSYFKFQPVSYVGTYNCILGARRAWNSNAYYFGYTSSRSYVELSPSNSDPFTPNFCAGVHEITIINGVLTVDGISSTPNYSQDTDRSVYLFKGNGENESSNSKISYFRVEDNNNNPILWLVPIQNNDNPCMIDLLTGTKYLNQGTGSFTYTLEDKQ